MFEGWRFGVFASIIAVTACLVAELIMLACAVAFNKPEGNKHGIGVPYTGGCKNVERSATLLAIPINIISTILVATSNYVMQCLSAPTRKDIDRAHAAGSYLNIGISSVHNFLHNVSWKSALWLVLVITTVPIHLLLNSAFFGALEANNYGVLVATEGWQTQQITQDGNTYSFPEWVSGETFFNTSATSDAIAQRAITDQFAMSVWGSSSDGSMEVLSAEACFKKYSKQLQSRSSNVVVVTKEGTDKYTTLPAFTASNDDTNYVDPYTAFQLPDAVGLSLNPFSGNSVLMLNESGHWQHGIVTANDSGGLYLFARDYADSIPGVKSIWSAFDYHYWTFVQLLDYDFNNSEILRAGQWSPTSWLCPPDTTNGGQTCTSGQNAKAPNPWQVTPRGFEVDHCLSQKVDEQCSLQYSFTILIIVICCDIAKILAMCAALWLVSERPLATIGDAIASFLESPDTHTAGCCLIEQTQARAACHKSPFRWVRWRSDSQKQQYQHANRTFAEKVGPAATVWKQKVVRWYAVPSKSRWVAFGILYVALLAASIAVLAIGIRDLSQLGINTPFNQGFGSINPNVSSPSLMDVVVSGLIVTRGKARSARSAGPLVLGGKFSVLTSTQAVFTYPAAFSTFGDNSTYTVVQTNKQQTLFADVITVNTPQILFSTLYFLYNGMFTTMVTAHEWSLFASTRKSLRVSEPKKGQRSTYWLQLPWKYSLPLLSISILLHWLVSRSLFLVRINVYGWDGTQQPDRDISAAGYSPLAILIVILIVIVSLIVMLIAGWKKVKPGIPVCGTNSVAIAAACHYAGEEDHNVVQRGLRWGVTEEPDGEKAGHCSMSDGDVGRPVEGRMYM